MVKMENQSFRATGDTALQRCSLAMPC